MNSFLTCLESKASPQMGTLLLAIFYQGDVNYLCRRYCCTLAPQSAHFTKAMFTICADVTAALWHHRVHTLPRRCLLPVQTLQLHSGTTGCTLSQGDVYYLCRRYSCTLAPQSAHFTKVMFTICADITAALWHHRVHTLPRWCLLSVQTLSQLHSGTTECTLYQDKTIFDLAQCVTDWIYHIYSSVYGQLFLKYALYLLKFSLFVKIYAHNFIKTTNYQIMSTVFAVYKRGSPFLYTLLVYSVKHNYLCSIRAWYVKCH